MNNLNRAQFKSHLCAWFFILLPFVSSSQYDIYWTREAEAAYGLISELRLDESLNIIRLQSITHTDNLIWPYLEDYALFLQVFVREDIKRAPVFLEKSAERMLRIAVIPESNPMSLMCQAQMHLHQCAVRLQQGQFGSAATDVNKAFRLLRKNQKLHPDDHANLRLYAVLKVAFGSIPDQYRWLVTMVTSMSGTIDEGMRELNVILKNSNVEKNIFYNETVLLTALAEGRLNNRSEAAVELIIQHFGKVPDTRIIQYVMANLQIADGNNDAAIRTLVQEIGPSTAERIPFLDFMLGKCKLNRGDDDADIYFKNFLLFHKGVHFIKEAYQKLGWYSLLKNNRDDYLDYMQLILIKGTTTTDSDKQAMKEAEMHEVPHPELLRSRLLFDGGYYEKMSSLLNETLYKELTHRAHRLEYLYRKGRLLHATRSYAEALHYYNLTIRSGEQQPYYFACSAALQSGLIHESLGSEGAAERYYLICLEMNPENYATSLHQKARMGLSRMGR